MADPSTKVVVHTGPVLTPDDVQRALADVQRALAALIAAASPPAEVVVQVHTGPVFTEHRNRRLAEARGR